MRNLSAMIAVYLSLCVTPVMAQSGADSALFWRVSKDGHEVGYLLGTIHSEDPRVVDFPATFLDQLKTCQAFAMEMVPDLPTLTRMTEYMQYAEAGKLRAILGDERFGRAMSALSAYQVPDQWKQKMKVWAVLMTLSVPPPETGFFMDLSLSLRAAGAGLRVTGLETLDEQLSFLENMPVEFQLELLDQALDEYPNVRAVHDEMVDAYLEGELTALSKMSDEQFAELDPVIGKYFIEKGIAERNRRMATNLLSLLKESSVFAAVGALHLPGTTGILALLRAAGYQLEPLPLPFRASAPEVVTGTAPAGREQMRVSG